MGRHLFTEFRVKPIIPKGLVGYRTGEMELILTRELFRRGTIYTEEVVLVLDEEKYKKLLGELAKGWDVVIKELYGEDNYR